jgi:hypothetical protein
MPTDSHAPDPVRTVADAVAVYRAEGDLARLLEVLGAVTQSTDAETLVRAAAPYRDMPEVTGPIYEVVVEHRPMDAQALVVLANAYWLAGRGAEAVGVLATRALEIDPGNRGAWHLWALTAEYPRERMLRWKQVAERFRDDDLARAAMADTAGSVAHDDDDPVALKLAVDTYRELLQRSTNASQRAALESAINALER